MIIAIDGPAASGKSTVAQTVAEKLRYHYLNSGNLYRAFTWKVLRDGIDPLDQEAVIKCLNATGISICSGDVCINGDPKKDEIHSDQVDRWVSHVSSIPEVRSRLNSVMKKETKDKDLVAEGRDMSTVVFPDADLKVYLDASVESRAQRRFHQGTSRLSLDEIRRRISERDEADRKKSIGSLKKAEDALYIDTSDLTIEQVCEKVMDTIQNTIQNST